MKKVYVVVHAIKYIVTEANNKYMKNHDKNKESSFLMYVDANNLCGWAMSKKLPVDGFKWVDDLSMFTEDLKSYDEEGDVGYLLAVDIKYPKTFCMLHSDLLFLPEKMKINRCTKLVCNVIDKENYSIHIFALKQALNHGLKFIRYSAISFRQEAWF